MRAFPTVFLLFLGGCAGTARLQEGRGASPIGAPTSPVDPGVAGPPAAAPVRPTITLPDRITVPATYRLILLDGHLALVRDTDPRALEPAPATLRIVAGEVARGELAYQPALLPQELAAEVAANRESSARMDNALAAVMQRSRELSDQAMEIQAQSRRLAQLLAAEEARARELESASGAHPKAEPRADPPATQDDAP